MLFHRCFGIRISSPFHLETLNIPIQNIKCPESPKNANIIMLPSVSIFRDPGISLLLKIGTNPFNCIFSSVCAMQFTHNNVLHSLQNWDYLITEA